MIRRRLAVARVDPGRREYIGMSPRAPAYFRVSLVRVGAGEVIAQRDVLGPR